MQKSYNFIIGVKYMDFVEQAIDEANKKRSPIYAKLPEAER